MSIHLKLKLSLCILPFLLIWTEAQSQNNFYVSNAGNNSNMGSLAMPWKTIQYSFDQLTAGDTLNIIAGTYAGKIDCNVSGSNGLMITVRNFEDDVVTIDGNGLNNYEYLLNIENVSFITIEGLHFSNYQKLDAIGISVINSNNISILNNEFSNIDYASNASGQTPNSSQNSQPIIVYGRDPSNPITQLKINNNSIHDCEVGFSECLSINGNVDGFEVMYNEVFLNTNIGIVAIGHEGECTDPIFDQARNGVISNNIVYNNPSAYASAGGIYIDGAKSVVVENNISYGNDYGIEVGCENNGAAPNDPSASDILVRNNLVYENLLAGIVIGGYDYPSTGKVENTVIRNNSLYNNDVSNTYNGELNISYVENSIIENNIFSSDNTEKVLFISSEANPSLSMDYNLYYSPSGTNDIVIEIDGTEYNEFGTYQSSTTSDPNGLFSIPSFKDINVFPPDLHLTSGSPAIDIGNPSLVLDPNEYDIDNESRINTNVDCGADEFYATTNIHIYAEDNDITVYPNPFIDKVNIAGNLAPYTIKIFDAQGNLITDYTGASSPLEIDLTVLAVGLHFIFVDHISTSDLYVHKIIKQ